MQEILGSYEIKAQLNGLMKSDQSPLTLKNMHSKYSSLSMISQECTVLIGTKESQSCLK